MMKILHTVQSYIPARHGMSEVVRQISERLAAAGHQVVVATSSDPARVEKVINGVQIVEFDISGSITHGIHGEYDRYIQFLLDSDFDIVTNFAAQQWATDLVFPILNRIRGKKVFVPTGYSGLYLPDYQSYFQRMKEWLKGYDRVVYLSDDYRDVNFARKLGLDNGVLIPNGASAEEFLKAPDPNFRKNHGIPDDDLLVLHVSGYVGGKGHLDAIRIFNNARIRNASLLFVCPAFDKDFEFHFRDMPRIIRDWAKAVVLRRPISEMDRLTLIRFLQSLGLFSRNIHFTALPRHEVVNAYQNADLFLFPSQIECSPIVLFECMASKTPFLSTDVGNAKEIVEWSGAGKILPTIVKNDAPNESSPVISASAKMLRAICSDVDLRRTMAESGYRSWQNKFTWEKISKSYDMLYRELTSEK
jgi:glycosyltransferase involved in cell wall biosynthesis